MKVFVKNVFALSVCALSNFALAADQVEAIRLPDDFDPSKFHTMQLIQIELEDSSLCAKQPVVSLYEKPSYKSKISYQAVLNESFEPMKETKAGWTKVQSTTFPYAIGWARDEETGFLSTGECLNWNQIYIPVKQKAAPIYYQSIPIMLLPFSARVKTINLSRDKNSNSDMIEIYLGDGKTGFIRKDAIALDHKDAFTLDEMRQFARTLVGTPYVEGGCTTLGFDNNGLVEFLFKLMKRQTQYDKFELDLIVQLGQSEKDITHRGVSLGNGEFIYAGPSPQDEAPCVCIWKPLYMEVFPCRSYKY
jgi:cell wall-associated NlpC family hydrolase